MEIQKRMFNKRLIGIHYANTCSTNPSDYEGSYSNKVSRFADLAKTGGFICAEYPAISKMIIGKILESTSIQCSKDEHYIKTLIIQNAKVMTDGMRLRLLAGAPRQGTLSRWPSIENRLEQIVNGKVTKEWSWLTPDEQEVICQEYLRSTEVESKLRLSSLLMPIGRTLKDVDIYGITKTGNELYAQVTLSKNPKTIQEKAKSLKQYSGILVFFCPKDLCKHTSGITFIGIEDVESWLLTNKHLSRKIWTLE